MNVQLVQNYLQPSASQINDARADALQHLQTGRIAMVIPMHEQGPVIDSLLSIISRQMPRGSIVVVNGRSDEAALEAVRRYPSVHLINEYEILDTLNWPRLLPILNCHQRPRGKGMTVLAGYLFLYYQVKHKELELDWVFQHDADITNYQTNRGLEFLMWGLRYGLASAQHIKLAQSHRDNERCMAGRSSLYAIANLAQCGRAKDLFNKLAPLKWMLAGQFGLSWEIAQRRLFAAGYLEETAICAFVEDFTPGATTQVANFNQCEDSQNDFRKEGVMQQLINNFLLELCIMTKPLPLWTTDDIRVRNERFRQSQVAALIPPDDGPVITECVPSEPLLPSLMLLDQDGFIDQDRAQAFVQSASSTPTAL